MMVGSRARRVLIAVAAILNAACSESLHRGAEAPSPSGRYVASFFGLSGGGAAGWAFEYVGIRRASQPFDPSLNRVLKINYGYEVCLIWASDPELVVEYPVDATVVSSEAALKLDQLLQVTYRPRAASGGILTERTCGGCLTEAGAADTDWSPCESADP